MAREAMTHEQTVRWAKIGGGALGGFVVLAVAVMALTGGGGDAGPAGDSPQVRAAAAELACQDMVRDQLKSPGSAKFSDVSSTGAGPWTVTGAVDADNSFGASIRSTWSCDVRLDGDTLRGAATLHE